jgi:hypothetical protein
VSVLSVAACSVPPVRTHHLWHPWRALRHKPHVQVVWEPLDGRLGAWDARTSTIYMHPRQGQAQGRVTATHEQIHQEWGHDGCQPERVEVRVRKAAARRLISIYALVDAVLFWGDANLPALAEDLWVDVETVRVRLDHLHPAERGYLQQRLAARDGAA